MPTEQVRPRDIRHGDVIADSDAGRWITVARIVSGELSVSERHGYDEQNANTAMWSFYGDERLDEQITVFSDDVVLTRKS